MNRLLALLFLLSPLTASGQEGKIVYTYSVKFDFAENVREDLKEMVPKESSQQMVLLFNEVESSMNEVMTERTSKGGSERGAGMVARFKMGSPSRNDQETLLATYVNHDDGTVIDAVDFMGKAFRIQDEIPTYNWKLDGEQSEFLGHPVQKATAIQDSVSIVAWFAPGIQVESGPGLYSGLPGMILMLSVDGGRQAYTATEVSLDGFGDAQISKPEKGDEVSRAEYEAIVDDKLAEMKAMLARRGSDRR